MTRSRPAIGIRREDKNQWERRAPLTPEQVGRLVEEDGIDVVVQPSELRIFPDRAYASVGAVLGEDLSGCRIVLGVKEMPVDFFVSGGCYAFFAHVIKGQQYNMPMLGRMIELGCSLIDYEKVSDDKGRRLVFFGRFAGLAGMVNTLHGLGLRLGRLGLRTPLADVKQARVYGRIDTAKAALQQAGERIRAEGLPPEVRPFVVGVTGYGHVAQGALEMLAAFGTVEVKPGDLAGLQRNQDPRVYYHVVFREEHTVCPYAQGSAFDLQEYYRHPERYRSAFDRFLPDLTALVNCNYWDSRYPRLLTREWLRASDQSRPLVVGDISCDVRGSIEATVRVTDSGSPFFVYDAASDTARAGVEDPGLLVMAVDNLPCEFPIGSSRGFGGALVPFVPAIARSDFGRPLDRLELPDEMRRGLVLHQGRLTPDFEYIADFVNGERKAGS